MPQGTQGRVVWIDRFKGLSRIANPDDSPQFTPDLSNVKLRFGRFMGRGGMAKYQSISDAAGASIIGLFNYRQVDGAHDLIRLLTNGVEHISGGVWTSIEGDALSGSATTRPQATIIDDTLIFTPEGAVRPQKYAGSGTTEAITADAPYCKGLCAYLGWLFLFNVSDDGTFTDVTDGHRMGRYSDDWDNDWSACVGNEIILDETPGSWDAAGVIGRSMMCPKSDGVVRVTFTTSSPNKFHQKLMPVDAGIVAPLSWATLGQAAGWFLGTDGVIYEVTEDAIKAVSYEVLENLLIDTASLSKLKFSRGMVDPQNDIYYLFYDRTGLSNQLLNSFIGYNYRSKEFFKGTLGVSINACTDFKASDQAAQQLIVASPTLVENFDSSSATDDDGTAISRYWTSNWQRMKEYGWLYGVRVVAKRGSKSHIEVSFAFDNDSNFKYPQTQSLGGASTDDENVYLDFKIPPTPCESVNIKIRCLHRGSSSTTEIRKVGFIVDNIHPVDQGRVRTSESSQVG